MSKRPALRISYQTVHEKEISHFYQKQPRTNHGGKKYYSWINKKKLLGLNILLCLMHKHIKTNSNAISSLSALLRSPELNMNLSNLDFNSCDRKLPSSNVLFTSSNWSMYNVNGQKKSSIANTSINFD